MSVAKIVRTKEQTARYENESDVYSVIRYIANMNKSNYLIGGGNAIIGAENIFNLSEFIAQQFLFIQGNMGRSYRRLYHIVVSFDVQLDSVNTFEIKQIAEKIIALYPEYQSVYVLHDNNMRYQHLHILFNNIALEGGNNLTYYMRIGAIEQVVERELIKYCQKGV